MPGVRVYLQASNVSLSPRCASRRNAAQRFAAPRNATQRNEKSLRLMAGGFFYA